MSELNDCMRALEQIGRREIRKSLADKPVSAKVAKAMAIGAGTRTPGEALDSPAWNGKTHGPATPDPPKKRILKSCPRLAALLLGISFSIAGWPGRGSFWRTGS